jgi:hypothetical protein
MRIQHKWETAGLGKSPYKYVGTTQERFQACQGAPIQCGTSCDYCGQGIVFTMHFCSADGKRFKVGCDCAEKSGDVGLVNLAKRETRRAKLADKHTKDNAKIDEAFQLLDNSIELQQLISSNPHPHTYIKNLNCLDYITWIRKNAGTAGKLQVVRMIKKFAKELQKI